MARDPETWADCTGSNEARDVSVWDGMVVLLGDRSFAFTWKLEFQLHSGAFWVFGLHQKTEHRWGWMTSWLLTRSKSKMANQIRQPRVIFKFNFSEAIMLSTLMTANHSECAFFSFRLFWSQFAG
jgi:hypothetical protein